MKYTTSLPFITAFLIIASVSIVDAQKAVVTDSPIPPTIALPTQIVDVVLNNKVDSLTEQVKQLSSESKLTSRVELLINLVTGFSTLLLGLIAFLVWKGTDYLREAKRDTEEIRKSRVEANKIIEDFKETADKTVSYADDSLKKVNSIVTQAQTHNKAIEDTKAQLSDILSSWHERKTHYSNASVGIISNLETIVPTGKENYARDFRGKHNRISWVPVKEDVKPKTSET